jgi:uncharacterized protein (DUF1015 family)
MARVHPFRAWRYSPSSVHLQDVNTQPYDRIYSVMEQAYQRRRSFNLVRILLELPEWFDAKPRESVYCRAAHDFPAWREKGVLVDERGPCIFADAKRFTPPGAHHVNRSRGLTAEIAFLGRPVPLEQRKRVTFAGDVLRPKSTNFFPQPASSVAIYALD